MKNSKTKDKQQNYKKIIYGGERRFEKNNRYNSKLQAIDTYKVVNSRFDLYVDKNITIKPKEYHVFERKVVTILNELFQKEY